MTASSETQANFSAQGRSVSRRYPASRPRFDLIAALLGLWFAVGLFVDGYAHNHGAVDDTFFTPYHGLLYSGILASGIFLSIHQFRNASRGYAFSRSLPRGYWPSLLGVVFFFIGGGFDFVWHELFGFEASIEALLSPAHLFLAAAGFAILTGPLRSAFNRLPGDRRLTWAEALPLVITLTCVVATMQFFLQFGSMFTQADVFLRRGRSGDFAASAIITGLLLTNAIASGALLAAARRWRLPFGAVTVLLTVCAAAMMLLRWGSVSPLAEVLLAAPIAGLAGDMLLARVSSEQPLMHRLLAFVMPTLLVGGVFVILQLTASGFWMSVHMWAGVALLAGVTGLFHSYLIVPPAIQAVSDS